MAILPEIYGEITRLGELISIANTLFSGDFHKHENSRNYFEFAATHVSIAVNR
jgi:hypothetical protein